MVYGLWFMVSGSESRVRVEVLHTLPLHQYVMGYLEKVREKEGKGARAAGQDRRRKTQGGCA